MRQTHMLLLCIYINRDCVKGDHFLNSKLYILNRKAVQFEK